MTRRSVRVTATVTIGVVTGTLVLALHHATSSVIAPRAPARRLAVRATPVSPSPATAKSAGPDPRWRLTFVRDAVFTFDKYRPDVWVAEGDGRHAHRVLQNGTLPHWIWNKRGLAFVREDNLWTARPDGSAQRQVTHWPKSPSGDADDDAWTGITAMSWNEASGTVMICRHYRSTITVDDGSGHLARQPMETDALFAVPLAPYGARERTDGIVVAGRPIPCLDAVSDDARYHFGEMRAPAFTREGSSMAFSRNGDIWIAYDETWDVQTSTDPRSQEQVDPRWTRLDTRRLDPVASYDGATYRGSTWTLGVDALTWSADGLRLAYLLQRQMGSGEWDLHVLTLQHTSPNGPGSVVSDARIIRPGGHPIADPCFSPAGNWIAYTYTTDGDEAIYIGADDGSAHRKLIDNASEPDW